MSNNFDLKKYLVENKLTTNSRMLNENEVTNYVDDLVDIMSSGAGKATGLTMLKSNVKNITGELKAKGLLDAVSKELTDYINTTEGFTFQDIKALEQHGYDMSGVNRSNLYDVDKMMNENENESKILNLYDLSDDDYSKLTNDLLEKHIVDLDDFLKSKGASPDEIEEIMNQDENTFEETENILGVKFPLLYIFEIGGTYVDNELVYDVGNGYVAIVEDYTGTYAVVPRSAFEEFKNAIQAKLS